MGMGILGTHKEQESEWEQETRSKELIDWTHFLSIDAVALLRSVLEAAYKHRTAYFKASDIKSAQIWSAMLEMQRQINELNEKIDALTPKEKKVYRTSLEDDAPVVEKMEEVMTPTAQDTREATDALVNSLMKF